MARQPLQLPPFPKPLGCFPSFFAQQSESIVLKERFLSFSGDDYGIKTLDGRRMFHVEGEYFSLSGRKHFMDTQGNVLFDIRKHLFSIPACYYAELPTGKVLFEVEGKFTFFSSKAECTFVSSDGKPAKLVMKGDFFDTYADIKEKSTGQIVACIDRKFFNARELLGGVQTYVVTVAPNVDIALIAAMCICLDERRND